MRVAPDPHGVRAGHSPPVDPAQLPELDVTLGERRGHVGQHGPAIRLREALPGDAAPLGQAAEVRDRLDPADLHRRDRVAYAEAGDRPRRRRIRERLRLGREDVERLAAQLVEQKPAHECAVVDVQPLRGGDERAEIAAAPVLGGGEEEMDVQARQGARVQAVSAGGLQEPGLPLRRDLVVAHVGRVADEERRALRLGKCQCAVVAEVDAGPAGQPRRRQVGAQHEGGQRIDVGAVQLRLGEPSPRGEQVAPRARTGVDHAGGGPVVRRPAQHRLDDRMRRVRLAERTALAGGADRAVGVTQRILAPTDQRRGSEDEFRCRGCVLVLLVEQALFGGAQIAGLLGAEGGGQSHQGGDRPDVHVVQRLRRHRHDRPYHWAAAGRLRARPARSSARPGVRCGRRNPARCPLRGGSPP